MHVLFKVDGRPLHVPPWSERARPRNKHDGRKRTNNKHQNTGQTSFAPGSTELALAPLGLRPYHGAACAARTVGAPVRRSTWSSRSRSAATSSGLRLSTSCPGA